MGKVAVTYSDDYAERLFQVWYQMGSPKPTAFYKFLTENEKDSKDEYGRIPSLATLEGWIYDKLWMARKDLLDAKVATKIDDDLVALKVNMLREQAAAFRAIRQKAAAFLLENDFDSSASAVQALVKGSQEERIAYGLSKTIQKMSAMDDDELIKTVRELAAKTGEVLDAADVEEDDEET